MRRARSRSPPAPDQVLLSVVLQAKQLVRPSLAVTMVSVTLAVEAAACTPAGLLLSRAVWFVSARQG